MIYKHTHKPLFIFLLILSALNISFSQKLKIDTVYYDRTGEIVTALSDHLTYEVRNLDRKKRIQGITARYTKSGRITESTTYDKGVKTGVYYRHNPAGNVMMYGDYIKGIKTGFWVTLDNSGSILTIEEYDNGKMIGMRERPYAMDDQARTLDGNSVPLETPAEFVGGTDGWGLFLRHNLKYPKDAKRYGYQGIVKMSFVVLSDGRIAAPKIVSSPHKLLSTEALRLLEISPEWYPGKYGDIPIDYQMTIRVVFRLK